MVKKKGEERGLALPDWAGVRRQRGGEALQKARVPLLTSIGSGFSMDSKTELEFSLKQPIHQKIFTCFFCTHTERSQ